MGKFKFGSLFFPDLNQLKEYPFFLWSIPDEF
jgi:hypothetical protein